MLVKGNCKQISNKRKKNIWYCRCGVLFLAVALTTVSLSGCGVVQSDQRKDSADQTVFPSDQAEDLSNPTSLKPGIQNQTPDIPYSDQIDTIVKNKDTWCFTMPADAGEEFGNNESDYYYWVTDMDQNGYLEVISSSTTGNGCIFYNDYYEVSQDGKSLKKLETDEREDAPAADLWYMREYSQGYYDEKTGTYHYPQLDHTHGSAVDTSDAQLDVVLSNGKVTINTISFIESESCGEPWEKDYGVVIEYYAGAKAEKLGEIKSPYDEKKGDFINDKKLESEYNEKLEKLYEKYYEGMQEFTVISDCFCNYDEKKYENSMEIAVVSEETLRNRVEKSWERFGIHVLEEKALVNPFFPKTAADDAEVRYLLDMLSEGKATMQMQEELRGNEGVLYQVTFCDPREVSNREGSISEKKEKKYVKQQLEEFYFYLWVTDTQIYYISGFYPCEEDLDNGEYAVNDDNELIEDDYQKVRLVFYGVLPENALLVCQEEEMEDSLKEMEEGDHQWIEKHGEDIRCYRSYTSRGEGYEGTNILQFVWKRGEGLIGVRYATHAAGGGGRFFWKEAYLEQEDVGFSID